MPPKAILFYMDLGDIVIDGIMHNRYTISFLTDDDVVRHDYKLVMTPEKYADTVRFIKETAGGTMRSTQTCSRHANRPSKPSRKQDISWLSRKQNRWQQSRKPSKPLRKQIAAVQETKDLELQLEVMNLQASPRT